MKKLIFLGILASTSAIAQNPNTAEDLQLKHSPASQNKSYIAVAGEGKTLPEGVGRIRFPFRYYSIDEQFSKSGKKESLPLDINIAAGAVVFEYGLTNRLSLQVKTNVYLSQKVKPKNEADIKSSDVYKSSVKTAVDSKIDEIAPQLVQANVCSSVENCKVALANNLSLPQQFGSIPANTPIQPAIQAAVEAQALSNIQSTDIKGKSGIGDTDIGVLYALYTLDELPVAISFGGGIRVPTGKLNVDADELPTGGGTTDVGLRLNIDYPLIESLYLSWQNQMEMMLLKGKIKNDGKDVDFERTTPRNVGFLKANWGLGGVTKTLSPLALYTSFNYDFASKTEINDVSQGDAARSYSQTAGVTIDGLAYSIPAQLELEYEIPVGGKLNKAASVFGATLKAYYRF